MKRILPALLLVLSLALSGCVIFVPPYSAESIEATVIDAETKQPLEGVVVVAHWELRSTGWNPGGSHPVGELQVLEAVTDQNGRFTFPAWGPIKQFTGELHDKDPELIFFKPGYGYLVLSNDYLSDPPALSIVHRSQWNGKTIEMKVFVDKPITIGPHNYQTSVYAQQLSALSTSLETIIEYDCNWKKIPRMLLALKSQKDRFRQQGIRFSLIGADYVPTNTEKCGNPDEFFKNYRP